MKHLLLRSFLAAWALPACSSVGPAADDGGTDTGADTDADSDTDTDSGSDSDTGADGCDDIEYPPSNGPDGCTRILLTQSTEGEAYETSSSFDVTISRDGSLVVFTVYDSEDPGITGLPEDTNGFDDVYGVDLEAHAVEIVSVADDEEQADGSSYEASVCADGRFVAFTSSAANLDPDHETPFGGVFLRNRELATTECVSLSHLGAAVDGGSPLISADGRFVAFTSLAEDVVPDDTNGKGDLFLRDRELGTTERLTLDDLGGEAGDHAQGATGISDDGRYVLFDHSSPLSAADDDPAEWTSADRRDVFLRDRQTGTNLLVSEAPNGYSDSRSWAVWLSPAGDRVLFFAGSAAGNYYDSSAYEWGTSYVAAERDGAEFTYQPVIIPGGSEFVAQGVTVDDSHLVFSAWDGFTGYEDEHANGYVVDRATDVVTLVSAAEDGTTGIIHHVPEMWDPDVLMSIGGDGKRIAFTSIHNGIVDVPLPCAPPRQVYLRDCP